MSCIIRLSVGFFLSAKALGYVHPCQRSAGVVAFLEKQTKLPCAAISIGHIASFREAYITSDQFLPGDLDGFKYLEQIALTGNLEHFDLALSIGHLQRLRSVDIETGDFDTSLQPLPTLANLKSLSILASHLRFTHDAFQQLPNLSYLNIGGDTYPASIDADLDFLRNTRVEQLGLSRIADLNQLQNRLASRSSLSVFITNTLIPSVGPGLFDTDTVSEVFLTGATVLSFEDHSLGGTSVPLRLVTQDTSLPEVTREHFRPDPYSNLLSYLVL